MHDNASDDASRMQPDASVHAPPGASALREVRSSARPKRTQITADWLPSKADEAFARETGNHPATIAGAFRDHYLGNGDTKLDWSAAFRSWCRKQHSFGPLAIAGGMKDAATAKADPEPEVEPITGTGPEAEWARATRKLKAEIGAGVYRTWLSKAAVVGIEDGEVTISLPTAFIRDYVRGHYLDRLTAFWRADNPEITRVQAIVAAPERRTADG